MNNFDKDEDKFEVLRKIQKNPNSSQRKLANDLGFSLGKLNYCVKALKQKGLIKIEISLAKGKNIHDKRKSIKETQNLKSIISSKLSVMYRKNNNIGIQK